MGERRDDPDPLSRRPYSSTDRLDRGRGTRDDLEFSSRGGRESSPVRGGRDADHSYEPSGGYRDSRGGRLARGGGGGGRGGGERGGRGRGGGGTRGGWRDFRGRDDGGRGRRTNAVGGRQKNFPIRHIATIEDTDEATVRLNSQIDDFTAFVQQECMTTDDTVKTLKVLSRVLHNDLQREIVLKILQVVCSSRFLDNHLTSLFQHLSSQAAFGASLAVVEIVEGIHQLLNQILLKLPSFVSKGILLLSVLTSMADIVRLLDQHRPSLVEDLTQLLKESQECMKNFQASGERRENRGREKRGPNEDDDIPPDDFTDLPIFPSLKDMEWNQNLFLRANKGEGSYRDVNHYLDVQFRLMREDYIRPLREGIGQFKYNKAKGEVNRKNRDLRLYNKVQIISMVCKDGLEHRLQFEMTPQLKRLRWQSSKRLIFGSLVCLTMDDFDTVFFAVVTNRDNRELEKGIIQVRFEGDLEDILALSFTDVFIMAETTAYFEAYRHVLEGLQQMKDSLPMSRYLVDCNSIIKPPRYLLTDGKMGKMDITALLKDSSGCDASSVSVINPRRWPSVEETTLNESQLEAARTALSKELAIVQGPPGTGKTYVGLKVAKVLLDNRHVWTDPEVGERPILVVCYTNHALDQFLEGILEFCPDGIVRVGSRCKTPQLEPFNLKNIRRQIRMKKKVSKSVHYSIKDCLRALSTLKESIDDVSSRLEATARGIVSEKVLASHMLQGQYASLTERTAGAAQAVDILQWMSKDAITLDTGDIQEDPYPLLAAEVTSMILQGEGTCQDTYTDPDSIHVLTHTVRPQLYRFWLGKVTKVLQQDVATSIKQGLNPQDSLQWREAARRQILPDSILKRVIPSPLFSAITRPLRERHSAQINWCVQAWLGLSDKEPQEDVARIIHGEEVRNEMQFRPDRMFAIPRRTRNQLYRFWLGKTIEKLTSPGNHRSTSAKPILAMANKAILPDHVLKDAMGPHHFHVIQTEMLSRHQKQEQYFISSWLGVQEFCQNAAHLQTLLDQLDEEYDVSKDVEGEVNAEEEADVIQNSRQLDVDDDENLFGFGKKKSSLDVKSAMEKLGVRSLTSGLASSSRADAEGLSVPRYHQKKRLKKIKNLLASSTPMPEAEAQRVTNLWSDRLKVEDRVRLYRFWLHRYQDTLRDSVKKQAADYNKGSQELKELRLGEDKAILEKATIIGMTTTGAARYRRVLTGVACPIVILEEAAEVLEAHVVTTLHKTCQHLILIGDHQQLRPSPTVYELSLHYKLDLSLFERLVNNRLHHSTLAVQHRMRPEIARLVRHVYPELKDHGTTTQRPHIWGMKQDVFLFHHEREEKRSDETSSKSNQHEAELCVGLCRYVLQQGYPSESVTILTAYSGQVFTLKTIMKKDQLFQGVRVTAVDNYQGEESDVIILSLVRSNQEGAVGFLSSDNRVCVALSRARDGFFAFGNFRILADKSDLWRNICRTAKEHGQLGDTLELRCENHPDQETKVNTPKDFDKVPEGGCKLPCSNRLSCGHVCERNCHGYDRDHKNYMCRKKCQRVTCQQGHPCLKKCFQDCGECEYKVTKKVPMCGHQAEMRCHRDPHLWDCRERCEGKLPCGHQCTGVCSDCRKKRSHVLKCTEVVDRVWPCGHLVQEACHFTPDLLPCKKPCEATLSCTHTCQGTCGTCWAGRVHVPCKEKCGRALPGCGHKCPLLCGTTCLPCTMKSCGAACQHSACKLPCGTPCQLCTEQCPWKSCKHQECSSLCHDPCSPCGQPCPKKLLNCGTEEHPHRCRGLCGEKCFCFLCEGKNFSPMAIAGVESEEQSLIVGKGTELIKLPQCGHIFKAVVLDVYLKKKTERLPAGAAVTCPVATCNKMILDKDCWRYHRLFRKRHLRFQRIKNNVVKQTTISPSDRQKLLDSLDMLTHPAEDLPSFASKAQRDHLFKSNVTINVNTAMALTNQIKMAKVFQACSLVVRSVLGVRQTDIKDMDVLQKVLYKPASSMTPQRREDLSVATRRLAYMTSLASAKHFTSDPDFRQKIEASLQGLCVPLQRLGSSASPTEEGSSARELALPTQTAHGMGAGSGPPVVLTKPRTLRSATASGVTSQQQGSGESSAISERLGKLTSDVAATPYSRRLRSSASPTEGGSPARERARPTQTAHCRHGVGAGSGPRVVPPKPRTPRSASASGVTSQRQGSGEFAAISERLWVSPGERPSVSRLRDAFEGLILKSSQK
ncbi:hypothetical protein ACOMHN_032209 [Nucella lapillus]